MFRKNSPTSPIDRAPIVVVLFALLSFSSPCLAQKSMPQGLELVAEGTMAPNVTFFDGNGKPTSIQSFRGRLVILNLWATWCGPCVKEMPSLERLAGQMSPDQLAVVAVSQDKGGVAVARSFLDRHSISKLAVYSDPAGRLPREYGGRGLPTTFVIGRNGAIIARLEGATEWDTEEMTKYLTSLTH